MMSFNHDDVRFPRVSEFFLHATRSLVMAGACGVLALSLVACGNGGANGSTDAQESAASSQTADSGLGSEDASIASFSINPDELFSERDLDASYNKNTATQIELSDAGTTVQGEGATVDGSTITIGAEGTYVLTGSLSDGRVVVDVDDTSKVQLVLDGAKLSSSSGTALYVRNADKVFVTLAEGSENTIDASGAATEEDEHSLDGAVFAADDLTVNGKGALVVQSSTGHGIVGKDELTLASGNVTVNAEGSAIQAKDSVAVKDGTYTLSATTDGIHAEHDSNGSKGFVYIAGGTFAIEAGSDGIDANNDVLIDGGSLSITAVDDGIHSEYDLTINDGDIIVSQSYEALEGSTVNVNGGNIDVTASDDGINATGVPKDGESDDTPNDAAGSDGMPGEIPEGVQPPDGEMPEGVQLPEDGQVPQMPGNGEMPQPPDGEMPEGVQPPDGEMPQMPGNGEMPEGVQPPEDGQVPQDGMGGPRGNMTGSQDGANNRAMGGGGFENDSTASVNITGGKLLVTAGGDGIDSNGSITVLGGQTYVNGPTSNGDSPLDYAGEATIEDGTFIAVGSAGMAQGFGQESTQGSMLVSAEGNEGDKIELKDSSGNVLASFTAGKSYACILASAPGVKQDQTYTLTHGSQSSEVTLDSITYSDVTGGMGWR